MGGRGSSRIYTRTEKLHSSLLFNMSQSDLTNLFNYFIGEVDAESSRPRFQRSLSLSLILLFLLTGNFKLCVLPNFLSRVCVCEGHFIGGCNIATVRYFPVLFLSFKSLSSFIMYSIFVSDMTIFSIYSCMIFLSD